MTTEKKTREDVDRLKKNWLNDPCFDLIPAPEGYEEYAGELEQFEFETMQKWEDEALEKKKKEMADMGLNWPEQSGVFEVFKMLEFRIKELEKRFDYLDSK